MTGVGGHANNFLSKWLSDLSLFIKLINNFFLFLNELLRLSSTVAVDISGGQDLLLREPLHVRGQLVSVLGDGKTTIHLRIFSASYFTW